MKREIEFRGRTAKGEWVYGYHAKFRNFKIEVYSAIIPKDEETGEGYMEDLHPVIPETVGQYVGITDKNGKKVYVGDIIKVYYFNNEYVGKVVFNERTCGFEFWYNTVVGAYGEKATHKWNFAQFDKCEVIGNIFDKKGE